MSSRTLALVAALCGLAAQATAPATAQGLSRVEPYGFAHGRYDDYGYADAFVRGSYVGAPLTRFPRPTEIVPTPWSYGTYGIPTVSGIAAAPAGQPTLTVINGRAPSARAQDGGPAGARVIEVAVPRR